MEKILKYLVAPLFAVASVCCSSDKDVCHITGTVQNPECENYYIFLIAEDVSIRDSVGVDSCLVKNQKFEFTTKKNMVQILRMDYHVRYNAEELLVVTEPGEIKATIGQVSSCSGTPSNEVLQQWKELTMAARTKGSGLLKQLMQAEEKKDTVEYSKVKASVDSVGLIYRRASRKLAAGLSDGPLKEFFNQHFPTKVKRVMPDGTTKEFPYE